MSDAVKNVTIRLNVVRGTIEPINASLIKDATAAYIELAKAEKSVVEQQLAVVDASKQVNQAQKSVGETARAAAQSAVANDEVQMASGEKRRATEEAQERDHLKRIVELRKQAREDGALKSDYGHDNMAFLESRSDQELAAIVRFEETQAKIRDEYRKAELERAKQYQEELKKFVQPDGEYGPSQPPRPPEAPKAADRYLPDITTLRESIMPAGGKQQDKRSFGVDTAKADAEQLKEIGASIEEELDSQRADRERKERETENRIQAERQRAAAESFAAEQQRLAQANEIELQASRMRIQQDQEERKLEEALLAEEEAANEKALAKQAADEMKFRQNMRDQQIKEEAETEKANERQAASVLKFRQDMRNQRIKEEAAEEQAKERQAAAELKFFQNMRDQRIKEEETAAEAVKKQEAAVLEFRSRMNQQRLREEETTANEVAQARGRLPGLQRGALQDVTQTIAAVATLTSHLSMLKSIGGDSLEDIAKKFAKVQSTVGLISSTQSVFSNIGEGLGKLQKMGDATRIIVDGQRDLNIATTLSQTATLRLAGAAGTVQAAMGPIALIATGIMAAMVAAELAMSAFGESAEDVAKRMEGYLKKQNDEMQKGIDLLSRQRDVMNEQLAIAEQQWETKRLLAGDDGLSMGDMMKENAETRARRDDAAEQSLKEKFGEAQMSGMTDEQKTEQQRIATEREAAGARLEYVEATGEEGTVKKERKLAEERFAQLNKDEEKLNQEMNTPAASAIANTQIEGGMIVDFDSFNANLQALPQNMQAAATTFVSDLSQQQREMIEAEQAALSAAESEIKNAQAESSQAKKAIEAEEQRFNTEEDMASQFGLEENKYAMQEVNRLLDDVDNATTADERERAANEAEAILQEQGLLSDEADKKLRGQNTDTNAVRMHLQDDAPIDQGEITESDNLIAGQTDIKMKADAIIAQGEKVVKDLKERLRAIDAQQQQLLQILDNRL